MTHATEVVKIRRLLGDVPVEDRITEAVANTTVTNWTVANISLFSPNQIWEMADVSSTGAEQTRILTLPTDGTGLFVTGGLQRGVNGSTATSHADELAMFLSPRYTADLIVQFIDKVLAADLYENDVFEIVEHQITSSATTNEYNAPSSSCEEFLEVYQRIATTDERSYLGDFTRRLLNVDTTLHSNGKSAVIRGNYGVPGTALYYVNCKHRLSITTISDRQAEAMRAKVCAYLLAVKDIQRTAGPTNQGDRTVRVGDQTRLSQAFWEQEFMRLVKAEAYELRQQVQPERRWIKKRRYRSI